MEKTHRCYKCNSRRFEFYLNRELFGYGGHRWICKNETLCRIKKENPKSSLKAGRRY
jgi:hypothetical protein